jgi:branched-chain amino acid aminotransferase
MHAMPTLDLATIAFSSVMSDHMFTARFADGAWHDPQVVPHGPLSLAPSASSLHYGLAVFEGLKAHRGPDGRVLLFRPRLNARRLQRSAARLAMPEVPEQLFLDGLTALLEADRAWVPHAESGALYIRPVLFSEDPSVRVKPAEVFRFLIFAFPFGRYFAAPLDVLVTEEYVRAFPGGTGDVKPAGNYAGAVLAEREARAGGFDTVLWLDGVERRYVEECGVMNVFFVIADQVVTPSLDGTILPGVTRDSVLTLLRDAGYRTVERRIAIEEILAAHDRGRLAEAFGTGTAAVVSAIRRIRYRDRTIELPPVESRTVGPSIRDRLVAIATGRAPDPHQWVTSL